MRSVAGPDLQRQGLPLPVEELGTELEAFAGGRVREWSGAEGVGVGGEALRAAAESLLSLAASQRADLLDQGIAARPGQIAPRGFDPGGSLSTDG